MPPPGLSTHRGPAVDTGFVLAGHSRGVTCAVSLRCATEYLNISPNANKTGKQNPVNLNPGPNPLDQGAVSSMSQPAPEPLAQFCETRLGSPCIRATPLPGGGSRREFFRLALADGRGVIGVLGHDLGEVRAFLLMTRHFAAQGIPVPEILAEDPAVGLYAMEDLGNLTLAAALQAWREDTVTANPGAGDAAQGESDSGQARRALETVVRWLAVIQVRGGRGLPPEALVEGAALDGAVFRKDLHRFAEHFLPRFAPGAATLEIASPAKGGRVAEDIEALLARLDALPREPFCYRDFQGRNIMWVRRNWEQVEGPVFLDYQSGRPGPLPYDMASLLYSPDTGVGETLRGHLLGTYLEALAGEGVILVRDEFLEDFYPVLLVRRLQALGAYADLGAAQGKPGYLEQIPLAVADLAALLREGRFHLGLPALERWLKDVLEEAGRGEGQGM